MIDYAQPNSRGNGAAAAQRSRAVVPGFSDRARAATSRHYPLGRSRTGQLIVNGQKVWTSFAQFSTRCVLLTRTGPGHSRHEGLPRSSSTSTRRASHSAAAHHAWSRRILRGVLRRRGDPGKPDARPTGRRLAPRDGPIAYERSSCFWQRIAYLYSRLDALISETSAISDVSAEASHDEYDLGAAYLALHTVRCRSRATQHRFATAPGSGRTPQSTRCCWPPRSNGSMTRPRPAAVRSSSTTRRGDRSTCIALGNHLRGTAEIQRNIIARRLLELGRSDVDSLSAASDTAPTRDAAAAGRLGAHHHDQSVRGLGAELDAALATSAGSTCSTKSRIRHIFSLRVARETGAHAPVLNDVVLRAAGRVPGGTATLPFTGGSWVVWERTMNQVRQSTAICRFIRCQR